MNPKHTDGTTLEAELRAYKGRYELGNEYFRDVLGRDGRPLGKNPFLMKRRGSQEFTWREVKALAEVLGMTWEEIDQILPDINR